MSNPSARRSIGSLVIGILIAVLIALMAPAPIALVLALVALPIEAHLVTSAIHGFSKPKLSPRTIR